MSNRGQIILILVAFGVPLLWAYKTRMDRQLEIKEDLAACFRGHPGWAARYYSRSTSQEQKERIFHACVPEMPDLDIGE
jgi:hypothetical protein